MPQPRTTLKRVIAYLTDNGETQANLLADALAITPGTLSSSVKPALIDGSVGRRKDGHSVFYRIGSGVPMEPADRQEEADEFNAALWADGELVLHNVELNPDGSTLTLSAGRVRVLRRLLVGQGAAA